MFVQSILSHSLDLYWNLSISTQTRLWRCCMMGSTSTWCDLGGVHCTTDARVTELLLVMLHQMKSFVVLWPHTRSWLTHVFNNSLVWRWNKTGALAWKLFKCTNGNGTSSMILLLEIESTLKWMTVLLLHCVSQGETHKHCDDAFRGCLGAK